MRPSGRAPDEMRAIAIQTGYTKHAEGSVLVSFGDTKVIVTASVEEKVPPFLRGKAQGWVTAEYSMLPRATHTRGSREAAKGKVGAVSCGICNGVPVLDLDYSEDSCADADANFVLLEGGKIAEVQATAEGACYDEEGLLRLLRLARIGCEQIFAAQEEAVAK